MKEEWKNINIKGLDYKVSNFGNVIGTSGKLLKQRLNEDGYLIATLGKNEIGRTTIPVHRLVAELFIENPNNLPEVNHKDFNRANPRCDNLEWTTHKENIEYTIKANRHVCCNKDNLRGANNPNYHNDTLKNKYKQNPELAKKNNSRPKEENGRAIKIILYDLNKNKIQEFDYIGACAEYLKNNKFTKSKIDSIRGSITKSIKNNKPYLRHYYSYVK